MKNIKLYKLQIDNTEEKVFILDIFMNDKINSHRYYFIKENGEFFRINRVKSIVKLLEYLEINGIRITEVSLRVKCNLISNIDKNITKYIKGIDDYTNKKHYFSELIEYDLHILKKIKDDKFE